MVSRGSGHSGPANGPGWGGPARGIGHNSGRAAPFAAGNTAAVGQYSFHRSEQAEAHLDILHDLALNAESVSVQIAAINAFANRVLRPPKPMQR